MSIDLVTFLPPPAGVRYLEYALSYVGADRTVGERGGIIETVPVSGEALIDFVLAQHPGIDWVCLTVAIPALVHQDCLEGGGAVLLAYRTVEQAS